jgi:hypothetical protein
MKKVFIFLGIGLFLISCKNDKITAFSADCPEIISFSNTIEPMILNNCSTSGCHNIAGPGKPKLMDHFDISSNAETIKYVISVDPSDNDLMPLGGPKLADSVIQHFSCWIDQGTLNN